MENFTEIELIESDELMASIATLEALAAEMASEEEMSEAEWDEYVAEYDEYLDEYFPY